MKFRNPKNGFIENKSSPTLWCLLFGALYFLVSGAWRHVLVIFIISGALYASMGPPATPLVILMQIIYCVFANKIIENHYLRKGWETVKETSGTVGYPTVKAQNPEEKDCPFCAEKIKYAAIKCKHCGADIEPPSSITDAQPVSDKQQMEKYDISFDGVQYIFREYKYSKLSDAISYAKLHKSA